MAPRLLIMILPKSGSFGRIAAGSRGQTEGLGRPTASFYTVVPRRSSLLSSLQPGQFQRNQRTTCAYHRTSTHPSGEMGVDLPKPGRVDDSRVWVLGCRRLVIARRATVFRQPNHVRDRPPSLTFQHMAPKTPTTGRSHYTAPAAFLSAAVIAVLALAACGGGSKTSTGTTATTLSTPSTSESGTTETTTPGATTLPTFSGSSTSSFCQLANAEEKSSKAESQGEFADTPAQLKKLYQQELAVLPYFVSKAPSAVKSDVQTIATVVQALYRDLETDNFNFQKLATDPQMVAQIQSPSLQAASNAIDGYLTSVCHINLSS